MIRKIIFITLDLALIIIVGYFLIFGQDMVAITKTTDQYMTAMSNGDARTAYSLLADRAQRISSVALYEQWLQNDKFRYNYLGYEKMCVRWIQFEPYIGDRATADPPYTRTASLQSCFSYNDQNKAGGATVFLEKENGNWRILGIYITAYPTNAK